MHRSALEAMFDSMADLLFVIDEKGCIIHVNKTVLQRLNYEESELIGRNVLDLHPEDLRGKAMEVMENLLSGRQDMCPIPVVSRDGMLIPVETKVTRGRWGGRDVLFGISRDITDRVRAQAFVDFQRDLAIALGAAFDFEEALDILLDAALRMTGMDCGAVYLPDESTEELRPAFLKGVPEQLLSSTRWVDSSSDGVASAMKGGSVYLTCDQAWKGKRGTEFLGERKCLAVLPILHREETIASLVVGSRTLTYIGEESRNALETIASQVGSVLARLKVEKALKENEERLNLVLDASDSGFVDWDVTTDTLRFNRRWIEKLGYDPDKIKHQMEFWEKLIHEEDLPHAEKALDEHLEGRAPCVEIEHRVLTAGGEWKWILTRGRTVVWDKDGKPLRMAGTQTDITKRKLMEEALEQYREHLERLVEGRTLELTRINEQLQLEIAQHKRTEEQLLFQAQLLDNVREAIIATDLDGRVIYWGKGAEVLYGHASEEAMGRGIGLIMNQQEQPEEKELVAQIVESGLLKKQSRQLRKDGTFLWVDMAVSVATDHEGEPFALIGIHRDITKDRDAEEELLRLSKAIEQAAEGIIITDSEGVVQYVNPAVESITGYSQSETLGRHMRFFLGEDRGDESYASARKVLETGEMWKGDVVGRRKDGTGYEGRITISPVRDAMGDIVNYVAVKHDVTQEVELERRLREAQKLEAVGTLAGGIAHDLNNILAAIMGFAGIAVKRGSEGDAVWECLQEVLRSSRRAGDLIRQIMTFSRRKDRVREPVSLRLMVGEVLKWLSASLPPSIHIHQDMKIEEGRDAVLADPVQIHQLLMNLCTNAAQSMPQGGLLKVELEEVVHPSAASVTADLPPGVYVRLSVADTGCGMDGRTLERIFEPYYTTRSHGDGTGLGLAVVHGVVKAHGGEIRVLSEKGEGTTFEVFLPRTDPAKVDFLSGRAPRP